MSNSTLIAHAGAQKMNREQIRVLPLPTAMGVRHRPVAHIDIVEALTEELGKIGLDVIREEIAIDHALTRTNVQKDRLFGIFDLAINPDSEIKAFIPARELTERGFSVGFRHSNDQAFALSVVAGSRIFVCDNLLMYGEVIAVHRKHTRGLNLHTLMSEGVDRLSGQFGDLNKQIERLQNTGLTDSEAKSFLIDSFCSKETPLAIRYLPDVAQYYFDAGKDGSTITTFEEELTDENGVTYKVFSPVKIELPDVAPRSMWGLNNAFTRVVQDVPSISLL